MLTEDNKDKSFNAYDDLKDNEALKALFETDGVRGIYGKDLTDELVYKIGVSYGRILNSGNVRRRIKNQFKSRTI